jgi:hypothetical protein
MYYAWNITDEGDVFGNIVYAYFDIKLIEGIIIKSHNTPENRRNDKKHHKHHNFVVSI